MLIINVRINLLYYQIKIFLLTHLIQISFMFNKKFKTKTQQPLIMTLDQHGYLFSFTLFDV